MHHTGVNIHDIALHYKKINAHSVMGKFKEDSLSRKYEFNLSILLIHAPQDTYAVDI